jgi:hypothetical protein
MVSFSLHACEVRVSEKFAAWRYRSFSFTCWEAWRSWWRNIDDEYSVLITENLGGVNDHLVSLRAQLLAGLARRLHDGRQRRLQPRRPWRYKYRRCSSRASHRLRSPHWHEDSSWTCRPPCCVILISVSPNTSPGCCNWRRRNDVDNCCRSWIRCFEAIVYILWETCRNVVSFFCGTLYPLYTIICLVHKAYLSQDKEETFSLIRLLGSLMNVELVWFFETCAGM